MRKAEERLHEESQRVTHYLDPTTEPKLREVVERELIAVHMRTVAEMAHSGIVSMFEDNKTDDLARAYQLFRRIKVFPFNSPTHPPFPICSTPFPPHVGN